MSLPLATTMVDIVRSSNDGTTDLFDAPDPPVYVDRRVRAVITHPSSRTSQSKGQRLVTTAGFRCDRCDAQTGDLMTDLTSGITYEVLSALTRYELGISYTYGDLQIVEGAP